MNRLIAAIAMLLLASAAGADDIYNAFGEGNSDLRSEPNDYVGSTVIQRGVGDSFDRYQGWSKGNPDLFSQFEAPSDGSDTPANVYKGFGGNPDLRGQ